MAFQPKTVSANLTEEDKAEIVRRVVDAVMARLGPRLIEYTRAERLLTDLREATMPPGSKAEFWVGEPEDRECDHKWLDITNLSDGRTEHRLCARCNKVESRPLEQAFCPVCGQLPGHQIHTTICPLGGGSRSTLTVAEGWQPRDGHPCLEQMQQWAAKKTPGILDEPEGGTDAPSPVIVETGRPRRDPPG